METVTISPKYQVVIPKKIRKDIGLRSGEKLVIFEKNGLIRLMRVGDIKKLKGRYKGLNTDDLRDEYC
jgi:AbrB family looped-hinge helix DNA binding protein